jgi:DNA modification methylase
MIKPYYDQDGITIYNCDCRLILPELPKVDLVLTDPPYGIGKKMSGGTWGKIRVAY